MASTMIGALRVALGLDTAQFEAGANKAAHIARSKSKEMTDSFAGARKAVEGLFAAFTVGLITEQVKKSLEYAGSLAEVAKTLGVTTKDLQTFRLPRPNPGVAQDQLEVGLRRLTVSMGKAQLGSKEQAKAFNAIGISVDQLKGKTTGDVFRLMADGLSKVSDRSQRAAIEMTLMGRSGSTLDNLLAPGARRLNELARPPSGSASCSATADPGRRGNRAQARSGEGGARRADRWRRGQQCQRDPVAVERAGDAHRPGNPLSRQ
jgi:hypothetical protein